MKLKALTAAFSAAIITVSAGAFTAFADSGDVDINNTNFPDDNFRKYVEEKCDKDGNGVLSQGEIGAVNKINVNNKKIADLKGIEYFTALTSLNCGNNQLTSLDVSKNTALEWLWCYDNQLTSLDVSRNTALTELSCNKNQLTELDVSKNTALTGLSCSGIQLTSLDVSRNTALTGLSCSKNQLTELDVSKNTALTNLFCSENQLTSLDVSKNTALKSLECNYNQLTSLDVSKNTALKNLRCSVNQLANLDVSKNTALTELLCYNNQLTSLDVTKNTALEGLNCGSNKLTNLDVSGCTALEKLQCNENQLANLDVSSTTALEELNCGSNKLANLDVSKNNALTSLNCENNKLTNLDTSRNTALKVLICNKNSLTAFNVNTALERLSCSDNQLTSLDVSGCTALTKLNCYNNKLTSLDVSQKTTITDLYCYNNQLTSLDVSGCTALKCLYCIRNQLASLDVSANTSLNTLNCSENHLTNLDTSKNTALEKLNCSANYLTSLDLSTNTALTNTNVFSYSNTYAIGNVTSYDLANLPTGFDITKASKWRGATLNGSVLSNFTSDKITYTYDCGNGKSETFTLVVSEKTDDTDDGDSTSDPVSSFVNRLYTIILDRPAESAGLADWTNALTSGEKTSADIVYGLANSDEFKNKALSNDEVIERMYLAMLGRPSDEGGKADWLRVMADGCTVNGIINGFSGSEEFANICSGYGISAGSVTTCEPRDKNTSLTAFISRMYTKALGRAYDIDGLNDWTGDYLDGKATANDIAYGFILSPEFESRGLSDEEYVDTLYYTFFDRDPDEGGRSGWLDELAKGTSRKDVLDGFLGADEFANLKKSFGV